MPLFLTYNIIADLGIKAYPNYQERAGHFKYSDMPKCGYFTREASIIIGTNQNGTAKLGNYHVSTISIFKPLISAYTEALFKQGHYVLFIPYILVFAVVALSFVIDWPGSPRQIFFNINA